MQILIYFLDSFSIFRYVDHSKAKSASNLLKAFAIEMAADVFTFCWSTETSFTSVAVDETKFSPHDDSGTSFFTLVYKEGAVIEVEVFIIFGKKPIKMN